MPAPDIDTVIDLEGQLEPATRSVLIGQDIPAEAIVLPRASVSKLSPYVELATQIGNATRRTKQYSGAAGDRNVYFMEDAWEFTLVFSVLSDRERNPDLHSRYRATIRRIISQAATLFTPELLPYHQIVQIRNTSTASGEVQASKNLDVSQLRMSGVLIVRPDAWPEGF